MGLQEPSCTILQLSDCTMMYILTNLDATSLFQLSRTCLYFKNIVEDPKLWEFIEARKNPNSTKKVQYVCDRIHDRTTHILMRAESKYDGCIPLDTLLSLNRLENLRVLALENQRIDAKHINLHKFPKSLVELSLKKTYVKNGKQFFHGSFSTMRNLRVLILDECDWLDSNFFISIAKYENLEILSIIKCMKLHFNVLPYLSIARHACKKMKIIDCRFNTISNEVLMQASRSVMALYFQSMSSYKLDTGSKLIPCPRADAKFPDERAVTIRNESLNQFKLLTGHDIGELPQSLLYQDPYPECSCKWKNDLENKNESLEIKGPWTVDDYIDFDIPPTKFICRKHVKELKKLPKHFKNFFYENQKKFYPSPSEDSDSDDDNDSEDDDGECCMFGVGKSQQLIVLKADAHGNLPQPEVINLFDIDDANQADGDPSPRASSPQPGPSTSGISHQAPKRKAEDEPGPSTSSGSSGQQKKPKLSPEARPSTSASDMGETSRPRQASKLFRSAARVGYSSWSRVVALNQGVAFPERAPFAVQVHNRTADRFDHIMEQIRQRYYESMPQDANKSRLRRLSLRGYRAITDEALISIRNLNLDLLDVTYTRVTKEGIANFLVWNPNCRVLHPDYCVCKPRIPC